MNFPNWIEQAITRGDMTCDEAILVHSSQNPDWEVLFVAYGCNFRRANLLINSKGTRPITIQEAVTHFYQRSAPVPSKPKPRRPASTASQPKRKFTLDELMAFAAERAQALPKARRVGPKLIVGGDSYTQRVSTENYYGPCSIRTVSGGRCSPR